MRKKKVFYSFQRAVHDSYHYLLALGMSVVAGKYLSKAYCLKQNQTMPNGYVHLVSPPIKKSNLQFYLEGSFLTVV